MHSPSPDATKGLLYLFVGQGWEVPFQTPFKSKIAKEYPNHLLHDIDLGADATTWHYTHQWLSSIEEIVLVLDGYLPNADVISAKKTVIQLLKYSRKIEVICNTDILESPCYAAFQPLERLNYRLVSNETN